jgi:hypothetical protein
MLYVTKIVPHYLADHGILSVKSHNSLKLKEFRDLVLTRLVKFWSDRRDIQLAIHGTMKVFTDRSDVIGWIPASEAVNTGPALEQIARLTEENAMLRGQLANISKEAPLYNGLSYNDMCKLLSSDEVNGGEYSGDRREELENIVGIFGDEHLSYIHVFFLLRKFLLTNDNKYQVLMNSTAGGVLTNYGLVTFRDGRVVLTDEGRRFLLRMLTEEKAQEAQRQGF